MKSNWKILLMVLPLITMAYTSELSFKLHETIIVDNKNFMRQNHPKIFFSNLLLKHGMIHFSIMGLINIINYLVPDIYRANYLEKKHWSNIKFGWFFFIILAINSYFMVYIITLLFTYKFHWILLVPMVWWIISIIFYFFSIKFIIGFNIISAIVALTAFFINKYYYYNPLLKNITINPLVNIVQNKESIIDNNIL